MKLTPIEEGLDKLCNENPNGAYFTFRQIADYCGCTKSAIQQIEEKAFRKIRKHGELRDHLNAVSDIQGGVQC